MTKIRNPLDPMRDLYPTCGEAYEAGKRQGTDDGLGTAISALQALYVKHEQCDNVPEFRAVGDCLTALRRIRREAFARNSLATKPVEGSA